MNRILVAVALLLLAACSKPPRAPLSRTLATTLEGAAASGPCSVMPLEWAKSYPVPLSDGTLKVFFYPSFEDPQAGPVTYGPGGEGIVASSLDRFTACAKTPQAPARLADQSRPKGERGGMKAYERLTAELLDDTETATRLYASKKTLGDADRAVLARYWKEFDALAEPGLRPFYYRANPAFWDWLRPLAGGGLSAP